MIKSEYGKDVKKKFATLIEKIELFEGQLNREELRDILIINLALPEQDASRFIRLIDKMIPNIIF